MRQYAVCAFDDWSIHGLGEYTVRPVIVQIDTAMQIARDHAEQWPDDIVWIESRCVGEWEPI